MLKLLGHKMLVGLLVGLIVDVYRAGGREAVVRALTIPERDVKAVTNRTGVDLGEALDARDAFAQAGATLAEQLVIPEDQEDDEEP
jgi:hypothetical protein